MPRYYLWLFVLAAALYAIHHTLFQFVIHLPMHGIYYVFYGYELLLSIGMYVLLSRAIDKRPQSFVNTFMAVMSIKMLASLGLLMGAIALYRDMMKPLALVFVVLYFAFMVYQVLVMRQMSMAQTAREKAAREAAEQ